MRAIAITPGQPDSARMIEVPRPVAPPGGALVKVLEVGIDGTDMELNAGRIGRPPPGEDFLVIGHESVGVVEALGPGVQSLRPGDLVVAMVRRPDDCPNCRAGESDMCLKGEFTERGIFAAHGYMSEYYAEREEFLVKIPPELRGVAVLLEPVTVAVKAIRLAYEIQRRLLWQPRQALVLGAGSLGLLAAFLLRLRGLEVAMYSLESRSAARAGLLEAAGGHYFSANDVGLGMLRNILGNIDLVFEATGAPAVLVGGMRALGANGVMAILGVSHSGAELSVPVGEINNRAVQHNQVFFGSVNANRRDFDRGVRDLAAIEERWPGLLESVFTRREPLAQFRRALNRTPEDIKVLVEV